MPQRQFHLPGVSSEQRGPELLARRGDAVVGHTRVCGLAVEMSAGVEGERQRASLRGRREDADLPRLQCLDGLFWRAWLSSLKVLDAADDS